MKTTYHESAHASHYMQAGKPYWSCIVSQEIWNSINGRGAYGYGTENNAGYIGVGEIWGNYFGARCEQERFGGWVDFNDDLDWYKPGFFHNMHIAGGLSDWQLYACLTPGINSISKLRDELIRLYPAQTSLINNRYAYWYQ